MQKIFSPAILVLNQLNYTKKFTLLWLMSLIAVAVVVYSLFVSLDKIIQPSQVELQGLALTKPIIQTIQSVQLSRGISSALLSGNETLHDMHVHKERETDAAFNAMEEKLPANLTSREEFRVIKSSWERLRKEGLNLTVAENFAAYTYLIEALQSFEVSVADEYLLTMDPEIASYYLIDTAVNKLPHALEHLGKIRAYGTSVLIRKQLTEQQKNKLNTLMAELDSALKELRGNLDKTGRHNPTVRDSLLPASDGIVQSARQITDLVTMDLLTGRFATSSEAFRSIATAEIDKSYAQMYDSLLPTAEALIQARIAQAKITLYTSTGIASVAFLLMVYLSISIYYAIVGSIHSLGQSARLFADGNLSVRIKLDTLDELSWVGDSFNQMADGFNAMLEIHREDEARLRATIETAMDAVVLMNAAGTITGWNSQAERIFGWSRKEAIGRELSETIVPHRYREAHANGLKRFLLTGEGTFLNSHIEISGLHRSGHEFPVELSIAPIRVTGQVAGNYEFSAFIRDIAERKLAEEALRASENRYRLLVESSPFCIHEIDLEGRLQSMNRAGLEMLGLDEPEKICGVPYLDAVSQQDAGRVGALLRDAIDNGTPSYFEFAAAGEVLRYFGSCFIPIKNTNGKVLKLMGITEDITGRKQHEREMRIAAAAFEAQEGITVTDEEGVIIRINQTFTSITGYSAEEAIGNTPRVLKSGRHNAEFYRCMWESLLRDKFWQGEIWNKRKNGEIYPEWLTITAVVAEDGKVNNYVAIFLDITERKRAEAEMAAINDKLEQANAQIEQERAQLANRVAERTEQLVYANRAKDSFLATMSHEIRTPLGGLLGMIELINLSRLDDRQREMLRAARDSGRGLLRIVNDILDWSKIEAGKLALAPQAATISEVLKGVVSTYSSLASAKSLLLRQQVDSKLSAAHVFDSLRLSQILNNFTSNAIKFTEQGTVEISAKLIAQSEGAEQVCFCVKDSGVGMLPEQQALLFQHYGQASADTARMYGGTGLGLAICNRLAELMEGTISVESTPGAGSTFCFTVSLPVASPAAQRELLLRKASENSGENTANITPLVKDGKLVPVLLVDDHPINRMLFKQQIEQLGLHAEEATNGSEALSLWQTGRFDLIITDCHMPEMDGYELSRSIRMKEKLDGRKRVPIIAWTANVLAEEEERCRAAGMDDILTKPTEMADLRAMLLKWLEKTGVSFSEVPSPEAISSHGMRSIAAAQNQASANTPIDFNVLKKIATSHAAQVGMLQEFNLHNRSDVAGLKATLKDGNPAAVARIAHRIKGASRMVGALELESICTTIEQAVIQGDLNSAWVVASTALDEIIERIEAATSAFINAQ